MGLGGTVALADCRAEGVVIDTRKQGETRIGQKYMHVWEPVLEDQDIHDRNNAVLEEGREDGVRETLGIHSTVWGYSQS